MNKIIAAALAATVLGLAAAPAMAVDTAISAKCGPEGKDVYKRPGGFCEQIGANQSLASQPDDYQPLIILVPVPLPLPLI